jgi:aminopeptidase N
MKRFLFPILAACFLLPMSACAVQGQTYPRDWAVDILHYRFHLTLSDASNEIRGRTEVTVRFSEEGRTDFTLDLVGRKDGSSSGMQVRNVTRDGQEVRHRHVGDLLTISLTAPSLAGEERTFSVTYEGTPEDGLIIGTNQYGERTFFGDNWPDRARHWLPTIDHVSDKATVEWIVNAPEDYEVVATGRLVERSDLPDGTELTHWRSEVPISPKVMVMGAARFAIRTTGHVGHIPIQAWVYPQDREAGFHDFSRAERVVGFFQDQIGPFPYEKLANVQSKTRYGGMENAGNIFYSERAIRGDGSNEGLIVHEIAHQWFGDSVTETDWNHIWLSEGFATYFTHLYNEHFYDRTRLVQGMERDRRTVIQFLARNPDLALVPPGYEEPEDMLNRNAYQKGSWVLHMLRRVVGDEVFWSGIRDYFATYRDSNARTEDFQNIMTQASRQDLDWFFHQWAFVAGHPVLEGTWSYDASSGRVDLTIQQVQARDFTFRFPIDIAVVSPDGEIATVSTMEVSERRQSFSVPVETEPSSIILDPDTWLLFEGRLTRR